MNILETIKKKFPLAYAEFQEFIFAHYREVNEKFDFSALPFAMQSGVFIHFFELNHIEFSLGQASIEELKDEIQAKMAEYEKVISHYS